MSGMFEKFDVAGEMDLTPVFGRAAASVSKRGQNRGFGTSNSSITGKLRFLRC
jgi:hypothetical protein